MSRVGTEKKIGFLKEKGLYVMKLPSAAWDSIDAGSSDSLCDSDSSSGSGMVSLFGAYSEPLTKCCPIPSF